MQGICFLRSLFITLNLLCQFGANTANVRRSFLRHQCAVNGSRSLETVLDLSQLSHEWVSCLYSHPPQCGCRAGSAAGKLWVVGKLPGTETGGLVSNNMGPTRNHLTLRGLASTSVKWEHKSLPCQVQRVVYKDQWEKFCEKFLRLDRWRGFHFHSKNCNSWLLGPFNALQLISEGILGLVP